jgi:hypothetical protein
VRIARITGGGPSSSQPDTTGTGALAPRDLSKAMSLFELDESLRLLLDSAWEAAK